MSSKAKDHYGRVKVMWKMTAAHDDVCELLRRREETLGPNARQLMQQIDKLFCYAVEAQNKFTQESIEYVADENIDR